MNFTASEYPRFTKHKNTGDIWLCGDDAVKEEFIIPDRPEVCLQPIDQIGAILMKYPILALALLGAVLHPSAAQAQQLDHAARHELDAAHREQAAADSELVAAQTAEHAAQTDLTTADNDRAAAAQARIDGNDRLARSLERQAAAAEQAAARETRIATRDDRLAERDQRAAAHDFRLARFDERNPPAAPGHHRGGSPD
jgi:hypothetical protein